MFDKRALQYMFTLRFYHSAWPLVLIACLIAFIFHMLSWIFLKKMFIALGCFVLYFFRNPKRYTADLRNTIVSPADGNIVEISESMPPTGYGLDDQKMKKVGIFLSPLNVHINRIPVTGMIEQNVYHPGQFLNAISHRAGTHNERRGIVIKMPDGKKVLCIQVSGFIARRIICNVQRGDSVTKGNSYGIIRFGSRVDLYLPIETDLLVTINQGLRAGESVIGLLPQDGI